MLLEAGPPPDFDGFTCLRCGRRYHLELDHRDPHANHGPTSWENIDPLCPYCHDDKTEEDRRAGLLDTGTTRVPARVAEQPALSDRAPP